MASVLTLRFMEAICDLLIGNIVLFLFLCYCCLYRFIIRIIITDKILLYPILKYHNRPPRGSSAIDHQIERARGCQLKVERKVVEWVGGNYYRSILFCKYLAMRIAMV